MKIIAMKKPILFLLTMLIANHLDYVSNWDIIWDVEAYKKMLSEMEAG